MANVGYTDTPFLPNSPYRVHDAARPQPRIITPGGVPGAACFLPAPSDGIALFDGTDLSGWVGKDGGPAPWKVENGYMEVAPRTGDIRTKVEFGNCQLHLEWATPSEVVGDSQGRGNSGVFLLGLYEIQVLDCFNNPTYADGTAGAIYGQVPPLVNPSRGPGEWQSYDIIWEGPEFNGDQLVQPAKVTVLFNGVVVQHGAHPIGITGHRNVGEYRPHPPVGPLRLQDHGNPMRFRNIWYRPLTG